jgi:hypothetical protein
MQSRDHLTARKSSAAARRVAPAGLALAGLVLGSLAVPAGGAELDPLETISGPSPFAGCTADGFKQQEGTLFPQTEIEPWVAANPASEGNLIAGWQQDRWSNGGARGLASAYSKDGGETWKTIVPPKISACAGGTYKRASDPWVSFAPDGTAYFMSLVFDPDLPSGAFGPNGMTVSRSTDGGKTWGPPIALVEEGAGQVLHDKNSLTADPTDARYAYAVWDRLRDFTLPGGRGQAARAVGLRVKTTAGDGVVAARERARLLRQRAKSGERQPTEVFFEGPAVLSRTTDGGRTWSPVEVIYDPGPNAQTIANQIVVTPDGGVLDFFTEILPNGGTRIGLIRSTDKGATFGPPSYPTTIATTFGAVTPDAQELIRDGAILFDAAVDPQSGNLYLVWQDVRFNAVDQTAFAMSTDGGATWSSPARIDKTPPSDNDLREQAIIPSIEVGPGGTLAVTYYNFRFDNDTGREDTDHWAILCDPAADDCSDPSSWSDELRLTEKSFNYLKAPNANGLFLGDYMGLVATSDKVLPVFGIVNGRERTGIVTRPIKSLDGARS